MPFLWRSSNYRSLAGEGGLRFSARWHTAGRRIVYLAESPAGAMIELLVHLELDEADWPRSYHLLQVEYPADLRVETLKATPAKNWKRSLAATRKVGDAWLRSGRSSLARVPSAILPETWNVLLNPEHAESKRVRIVKTVRAEFDTRRLALSEREKESSRRWSLRTSALLRAASSPIPSSRTRSISATAARFPMPAGAARFSRRSVWFSLRDCRART